ncbi:MAG: hypothetical protein ACKOVI_00700 [Candidatus Planktophila sp.]
MVKYPKAALLVLALAMVCIPIAPGTADTQQNPTTQNNWLDESKPIMTYCQPDMYACAGYQPLSDEQYLPPWAPGYRNIQGYYHNDLTGITRMPSYALAVTRDSSGQATKVISCTDVLDSKCAGSEFTFSADLQMCSGEIAIDCIRDITITDANNKPLAFTVEGEFPKGNPQFFKGSTSIKVPTGGGSTLIHIPGAQHAGGDAYLIKPTMTGARWEGQSEIQMQGFNVSISAVKIIDGKYSYGGVSTTPALYSKGFSNIGNENGNFPSTCAAASPTQCALKYALPLGMHFGMTIDLSRKVTGWLHGRVKAPQVEVSKNSAGGTTIKVSAEPIKIPVSAAWVNNDTAAQSIKDFYTGKENYGSPLFGNENKSKPLSEIVLLRDGNQGHTLETLNEFLAWLPTLGDKAQAMPTIWSIQTMSSYEVSDQIQKCLNQTDALAGIVTTNASEYLDGPPLFDKSTGSLDYKVAATHFEPDGTTIFRGTYDLVMSSKVARCIYGFTNAPINATVSVTSESGTNNVATTVVNERNGWLSLGAYNFTYSNPTIRVILTGTKESAAPAPVLTKKPNVVKQITCVKGKVTKKVSAGKCPTGYRKKV